MSASGDPRKFQGWTAFLDNGDVMREWEPGGGERSAWQRLLHKLQYENRKITQMRLQRGGVTLFTVSHAEGYVHMKQARHSLVKGQKSEKWGIGYVSGNSAVMVWIDDNRNVYMDHYPLEQVHHHSTFRAVDRHI